MVPNQCSPLGTDTKRGCVDHRMACAYKILQLSRHVPCCKGPILATDKYIFIQPRISKGGQATFNSNSPDAANYSLKPNTYTPLIQVCTYPSHRNIYIYISLSLSLPQLPNCIYPSQNSHGWGPSCPGNPRDNFLFPGLFSKKAFHPIVLQTNRLT